MIRKLIIALTATAVLAFAMPLTAFADGDAAAGKSVFMANCMSCHGMTGKGDGPVGKALNPPPRDFSKGEFKFDADKNGEAGTDEDLAMVIKNGAGAYGGTPLMAPWPTLNDQQVSDLVAFIRSLKE